MSPKSPKAPQTKGIFIFDNPKTRSHVFSRWLSTCNESMPIHHPFMTASLLGPKRFTRYTRASVRRRQQTEQDLAPFSCNETHEDCNQQLKGAIRNAHLQGLIPLANEHCAFAFRPDAMFPLLRGEGDRYKHFSNPTHIPDNLFNALLPVLVIRNPILVLDSLCRAIQEEGSAPAPAEEDFDAITTLKLSRHLFDGFCSWGRKPLVVDGDDVLWHTSEVAKAVCEYIGVDADGLNDTWRPYPEHERPTSSAYIYEWTKVTWESDGIKRPAEKPNDPELEKSVATWEARYGSEASLALEKLAEQNLRDYEYLSQFKVGGPLQDKELMTPISAVGGEYFNLVRGEEEGEEGAKLERQESCTPF